MVLGHPEPGVAKSFYLAGEPDRGAQRLPGGQSFQAGAAERAILVFDDDQHSAHSTLTSDRSFSTSCAAISAGEPVSISVCFCFSGR